MTQKHLVSHIGLRSTDWKDGGRETEFRGCIGDDDGMVELEVMLCITGYFNVYSGIGGSGEEESVGT